MRKFLSLLLGICLGAALGGLLVAFFSPVTADELREGWAARRQRALEAGRKASAKRRAELEKELADLRNRE